MPRRFPSGWAPFLAAAMVAAGIATLGAVPARAQDDNIPPPPPPPGDDAAAPEDVPPPQTEPPAQPPDQQTFERSLSPYGHWVDTPEYGRVWIPDEGADWQPYTDGGVGSTRGGAAPRSGGSYRGGFRSSGGRPSAFHPWTHPNSGFRAGSGFHGSGLRAGGFGGSTFRSGGGFRGSGGFGGSTFRSAGGFRGGSGFGGSTFRGGGSFAR